MSQRSPKPELLPIESADFTPLVELLIPEIQAEVVFQQLSHLPHCLFLDSAMRHESLGRYSFVAADPFYFLQYPVDHPHVFAEMRQAISRYKTERIEGLPPFQGGVAGLWSYDLAHSLEKIPRAKFNEFQLPAVALGFYDVVVAFDHQSQQAWIISQGLPETEPVKRKQRAENRLAEFKRLLKKKHSRKTTQPTAAKPTVIKEQQLAPQYQVSKSKQLTSNFTKKGYLQAVSQAIEYIYAGDIFQVNVSQRLLHPAINDSISLYLKLRDCNPATFAGYFDLGQFQILSASPERFVSLKEGMVETRPIKGTRQRTAQVEANLFAAADLLQSEKDRAENVMIVDLLRNDLSKVCLPQSVQVTDLFNLEKYEYVQHLVSAVVGKLQPQMSALDLLQAVFPGGSITGAPKIRAMEIIAQLEPTARGAYCGALGYLGFDGTLDSNILIRTITAAGGWWQLPVGGGIVALSSPEREYEETWHKAEGLLRAFIT